ncbi:MAG: response regulator [Saprospiraceae bacterium]|nr:response regulator [Saprospiraceae bacterium]
MVRVLIIDDEALARQRVRHLLTTVQDIDVIGESKTGTDAIEKIRNLQPDLIFLDIQMKDMTGFEVLEALPKEELPMVIFITAYDKYAIKAFDVFAFDYLLKPFKDERFHRSVENALTNLRQQQPQSPNQELGVLLDYLRQPTAPPTAPRSKMLPLKSSGKISFVDMNDIQYITGSGYYIEIFTTDKKYLLRETLTSILTKLDQAQFLRIHRSSIINLQFLNEVIYGSGGEIEVQMKNGELLRLSKSYRDEFFQKLGI